MTCGFTAGCLTRLLRSQSQMDHQSLDAAVPNTGKLLEIIQRTGYRVHCVLLRTLGKFGDEATKIRVQFGRLVLLALYCDAG